MADNKKYTCSCPWTVIIDDKNDGYVDTYTVEDVADKPWFDNLYERTAKWLQLKMVETIADSLSAKVEFGDQLLVSEAKLTRNGLIIWSVNAARELTEDELEQLSDAMYEIVDDMVLDAPTVPVDDTTQAFIALFDDPDGIVQFVEA